jgi:glutamate-1-semialdehyde 2,1-aminomutase
MTDLFERALAAIPGGSSTAAKSPLRAFPPLTPSFAVEADGASFIDECGRRWLDADMALGSVIWGYRRGEIDDAIRRQLQRGVIYSVPAVLEIETAEAILQRLSLFEALRFCKNGADAVAGAVRIARSATGRRRIIAGTYHGWPDWSAYQHYGATAQLGIPADAGELTLWTSEQTFDAAAHLIGRDIAAVVVCPEHWTRDDLQQLRAACSTAGSLLIFDEVKSGMRYGRCGVYGEMNITPDLLCISKGLANGMALAALVGPRDLIALAIAVRFTGTHWGECLPLAAAAAGERMLARASVWPSWRAAGDTLMNRLRAAVERSSPAGALLTVEGYPGAFAIRSRGQILVDDAFRPHFIKTVASHGIFSTGAITLSDRHTDDDVTAIAAAAEEAIATWSVEESA